MQYILRYPAGYWLDNEGKIHPMSESAEEVLNRIVNGESMTIPDTWQLTILSDDGKVLVDTDRSTELIAHTN